MKQNKVEPKTEKEKAFNNWKHNAIHLTFPNGNAISTVWGYCTYSDNHDLGDDALEFDSLKAFQTFMQSDTVEIMILEAPKKLRKLIETKYGFGGDTVKGYLSIKEWLEIVNLLSTN